MKLFTLLNRRISNGKRTSRLPQHSFAALNEALALMGGLRFGLSGTSTVRIYDLSREIRINSCRAAMILFSVSDDLVPQIRYGSTVSLSAV